MEEDRISGRQLRLIMIGSVTVMGHLYVVPMVYKLAGRDGWLSLLVALVPGLVTALVLAGLGWSMPGRSLVEMSCALLGKPLGKLVSLVYVGYFLLVPAITMRGLMDFMKTSFMPQTPPMVFGLVFLFICAYAVLTGLQTLMKTNEMVLPILITAGILLSGITLPNKDFQRLLPVLESGLNPVLRGSIPLLGLLGEIVVIGMVQPAVKRSDSLWKTNLGAVLIIVLLFAGPLTGPVAIFGAESATRFVYPTFSEMQYTRYGYFLEYLQSAAIFLWLFGSLGRVSLFYYASTLGASQLLGLTDYRKFVAPVGIVILALSIFSFPNILTVNEFLISSYARISIGLGMILPAVLLTLAIAKR